MFFNGHDIPEVRGQWFRDDPAVLLLILVFQTGKYCVYLWRIKIKISKGMFYHKLPPFNSVCFSLHPMAANPRKRVYFGAPLGVACRLHPVRHFGCIVYMVRDRFVSRTLLMLLPSPPLLSKVGPQVTGFKISCHSDHARVGVWFWYPPQRFLPLGSWHLWCAGTVSSMWVLLCVCVCTYDISIH